MCARILHNKFWIITASSYLKLKHNIQQNKIINSVFFISIKKMSKLLWLLTKYSFLNGYAFHQDVGATCSRPSVPKLCGPRNPSDLFFFLILGTPIYISSLCLFWGDNYIFYYVLFSIFSLRNSLWGRLIQDTFIK